MSCRTNSYNLPISHKLSTKSPIFYYSSNSTLNCRAHSISSHEATQTSSHPTNLFNIKFQTLEDCKLGIGSYPDFEYDANGGIGSATGKFHGFNPTEEIFALFDLEKLYIPPLTGATTRFLGLPLPPFLKIDIAPEIFQGSINRASGKVELQFRAKFWFSTGMIYRAPPLMVETILTSEESKGSLRSGKGERLDKEGKCRLVGVATVDPIDDVIMNSFLSLPTECIAELSAQIFITTAG
ncbi:hypothetical protein M5K25_017473 [Dendrobium thyrsiflorum]|uniref:Uncharacterized protein n=1 Tax=Dendrobium thyrsiflorum TaxID=117978 RepID=A0ABD0UV08_DENTH